MATETTSHADKRKAQYRKDVYDFAHRQVPQINKAPEAKQVVSVVHAAQCPTCDYWHEDENPMVGKSIECGACLQTFKVIV